MYTADHICKLIEFLIDNIFVLLGGYLFPSGSWNSNVKRLCSITCLPFLLLIWEWNFEQYDKKWQQETCQVIYKIYDTDTLTI